MAYSVDNFSGSKTIVIEDGTVDSTLDIRLIGKNYAGYGEIQNENFFHMLENFAGRTPPTRPIDGQIWYDSLTRKIKFYDITVSTWRTTGGVEVGPLAPSGLVTGDLWYNSQSDQLYVNNGNDFTLVGPAGVPGFGVTRFEPILVTDNELPVNNQHALLAAYVDDEIIFVVSRDDEFQLSTSSQNILGTSFSYGKIKPGITLVNTNNTSGDTETTRIFWGTSSHSLNSDLAKTTVDIVGGQEKSVVFQTSPGETEFVPPNTSSTRKILSQIGNGTVSTDPEWIILPTVLPISKNDGTILNIPLANGTFSVTTRSGSIATITVN